jgi:hypothetical protein
VPRIKKKAQSNILLLSMALIVAIIVVGIIWGLIEEQQNSTTITDDTFTVSSSSCVRVTNQCIGSLTAVENASVGGTDWLANFTRCGAGQDFYGLLVTTGSNLDGSTANATYAEISCQHITGVTSTVISYIPLLLGVALLVFTTFFIGKPV